MELDNKKREEIAQLIRSSIQPKPKGTSITIEKVVVLVPPDTPAALAAFLQALKDL